MALKNTQQPITMVEYAKKMDKIIANYNISGLTDECLMAMLKEAGKYHIVDANKTKKKNRSL